MVRTRFIIAIAGITAGWLLFLSYPAAAGSAPPPPPAIESSAPAAPANGKPSIVDSMIEKIKSFFAGIGSKVENQKQDMINAATKPVTIPETELSHSPAVPAAAPPASVGNAAVAPIVNIPADTAPAAAETPNNSPIFPETPDKYDGRDFSLLPRQGELMMSRKDMQKIYDALSGVAVINKVGEVEIKAEAPSVAPSFYAKSVLYFSPANWSVWVNNRKFTPFYNKNYDAQGLVDFEISQVMHDRVALIWHTHNLDVISPGWRDKFTHVTPEERHGIKEPGFISATGNVFISDDTMEVRASLAPNQTFATHTLTVEEGYLPPTPIMVPTVKPSAGGVNINTPQPTKTP